MNICSALLGDENGVVISAELVLVLTIAVLAIIVGLSEVAVAANTELNDISNAIGALNQSFFFSGFHACDGNKVKSRFSGSQFHDTADNCDLNTTCELVCGNSSPEDQHHN
jgi:hypothetical protein